MEIKTVVTQEDGSYRVNDNVFVPNDMGNRHRVIVEEWINAGNTPTPYVAPEPHWIDKRLANKANGGYGSIGEQLDMQYWDAVNGTTLWQEHIAKVKSDVPKE